MPDIDIDDAVAARQVESRLTAEMRTQAPTGGVDVRDVSCPRPDTTVLSLRLYRPTGAVLELPALVFIHGGSFVTGDLDTEDSRCRAYAHDAGCAVIAVEYRLAPEHPYPAGVDDCFVAVKWVVAHAAELGVHPGRVAVGGLSAGAALAAATALRARDRGGPVLALQLLLFPVLDARADSRSMRVFDDTPVLTSATIYKMWRAYLGPGWAPGANVIDCYASPAHAADLTGLPATYLCTAEFDPLRDEGLAYAQRLLDSDVTVELHQYPRTFHAFDSFAATRVAQAALADQVRALRTALSS